MSSSTTIYTVFIASTGSSLAADRAGINPAINPIVLEIIIPNQDKIQPKKIQVKG